MSIISQSTGKRKTLFPDRVTVTISGDQTRYLEEADSACHSHPPHRAHGGKTWETGPSSGQPPPHSRPPRAAVRSQALLSDVSSVAARWRGHIGTVTTQQSLETHNLVFCCSGPHHHGNPRPGPPVLQGESRGPLGRHHVRCVRAASLRLRPRVGCRPSSITLAPEKEGASPPCLHRRGHWLNKPNSQVRR